MSEEPKTGKVVAVKYFKINPKYRPLFLNMKKAGLWIGQPNYEKWNRFFEICGYGSADEFYKNAPKEDAEPWKKFVDYTIEMGKLEIEKQKAEKRVAFNAGRIEELDVKLKEIDNEMHKLLSKYKEGSEEKDSSKIN